MKIKVDPLGPRRQAVADIVNGYFDEFARRAVHREAAWKRKREIALAVKNGDEPPTTFQQEAELRKIDVGQLADLILSKSNVINDIDTKELRRQQILHEIEACMSLDELTKIQQRDSREIVYG